MSEDYGFASLKLFDKGDYRFNILIGERSNGKTFCVKKRMVEKGLKGIDSVFIRRYDNAVKEGRGQRFFEDLVYNDITGNLVEKLSHGKYNNITYFRSAWYFSKWDEVNQKFMRAEEPFCYFCALNTWENYKGNSFPKARIIFFDEFISDKGYLKDEFSTAFLNTVSTIMRVNEGVKIYMAGNTISQSCEYFDELGIYNIQDLKKGSFNVYKDKNGEESIAVLFTDTPVLKKNVNKYFAFNTNRTDVITGENGAWSVGNHRRKPCEFEQSDIVFMFFIEFNKTIYQCEIVQKSEGAFIFAHKKTGELKLRNDNILFSPTNNSIDNRIYHNIFRCPLYVAKVIKTLIETDKIYYSTNRAGEDITTYFDYCRKNYV